MLQYNKTQSNTHNTIRYHTIWKCYILYHLVYQFSHLIEQLLVQGRCLLTVPPPWPEMSLSIQQKSCSYLTRAPVLSCYLTCTRPPCLAMTLVPQVIIPLGCLLLALPILGITIYSCSQNTHLQSKDGYSGQVESVQVPAAGLQKVGLLPRHRRTPGFASWKSLYTGRPTSGQVNSSSL